MKAFTVLIGRILVIVVLSLSWLAPGAVGVSAGDETDPLVARVQTPDYELTAEGVAVADYVMHTVPGAPMLPLYGLTFDLPLAGDWELSFESNDSRILPEQVTVAAVPVADLDLNGPVAPQDRAELPSAVPVVDRPDPAIYGANAFYPASPVVAGEPMVQGGRRILPVRVFPFQYNPVTRQLRYHPDLLVTVQVQRGAEAMAPAAPPPGDFYQPTALPGDGVLRIHTKERGLYLLTYADLSAKGVPAGIDLATFAIYYKGQQIDIEVRDAGAAGFGEDDLVIFYAVPYDGGRFQDYNVYQFAYGGGVVGQRIAARNVSASAAPADVSVISRTLRVENNKVYRSLSDSPRPSYADHFFDQPLEVKTADPVIRPYTLNLSNPVTAVGNSVQISAVIHGGKNHQGANPDQSVLLRLNGNDIGPYTWDGMVDHQITVTKPASWLNASSNQIELVAALAQLPTLQLSPPPPYGDGTYYWISPDWVQISYPSRAMAASDRLYIEGLVSPTDAVAVSGFTGPTVSVFDVSVPSKPQRLIDGVVQAGGMVYWGESVTDRSYMLSTEAALLAPGAIERIDRSGRPAAWANDEHTYDYIAIVGAQRSYNGTTNLGDQLATAVQPLLTYRTTTAGGGYNVALVPVQDIYDEWSYGRIDPMAIRSFLRYAYDKWTNGDTEPPPGYVLLVGDGHYDYNKVTTQTLPQLVPPYLADVDPWLGEVPTDNLYVSVDSLIDYLPNMAVGRLPVNNAADVSAMVAKILAYEGVGSNPAAAGPWQQRAVYVAGNCNDPAGFFHELSNWGRLQWLPTAYANQPIYFDLPGLPVCPEGTHSNEEDARLAVRTAYNQGAFYMQWFGHGSSVTWGGGTSRTLRIRDLRNLSMANPLMVPNSQLPFTAAYTCLSGYFVLEATPDFLAVDYKQSLAEEMVLAPQRGSIADLSPSGLHLGSALLVLQKGMHKKLFEERIERAGDVVDAAKYFFFENSNGNYLDVIDTMIFFGDPALKLRYPTGDLSTSTLEVSDDVAAPGATLAYTLTVRNSSIYYTTSRPQVVVDYPQDRAIVVSASSGAVNIDGTLRWNLPDLPPNSQQAVAFSLQAGDLRGPEDYNLIVPATVSSQMAPTVPLQVATQIQPPLSVELEYFTGTADYPSHILLEWQSVSEQSTLAFRLRRGTSPDPTDIEWTSPVFDAHPGSTLGYYYSYQDNFNLAPGTTYYYWIEDQDNNGIWNQHLDDPVLNPVVPWGCSDYDVVCNFVVDSQDITAIASLWNCALGSACYDAHYDVNNDNVIDVQDIMLSASRWGCQRLDVCYN